MAREEDARERLVVFYDGVCGLCDHLVRFLIVRDRGDRLRFAPLQGRLAATTLPRHGADPEHLDALRVLVDQGTPRERLLRSSDGVLRALAELPAPWRWLAVLRVVPRPLREAAYTLVARTRYRIFGRRDACRLPTPAERERFIDAG